MEKNKPTEILIHGTDYSYRLIADQFKACNGWHRDRWNQMILKNGIWTPAPEGETTGYQHRYMTDDEARKYGTLSSLGNYHGYHHLITGGKNYKCREDNEIGAHCNQKKNGISINLQSLAACVGFDGDIEQMTSMDYALLQQQVWFWQDQYGIPDEKVGFHRDYAVNKTCPGSLISKLWLVTLLRRPSPAIPAQKPVEKMCIVHEKEIVELKKQLTWFERFMAYIS
jgi:hypothetical protein